MSNRYEFVNFLNAHDEFIDNDKCVKFDSFEAVRTLNHYWNLLNEQDKKIKDLEHRLSNCIELPQGMDVGKTVYYVTGYCNEEGDELYEIEVGLVHWIEKALRVSNIEFDDNENLKETYDGFNYTIYVRYESGLTFQHSFEDVGVDLFATEEEAKIHLKILQEK